MNVALVGVSGDIVRHLIEEGKKASLNLEVFGNIFDILKGGRSDFGAVALRIGEEDGKVFCMFENGETFFCGVDELVAEISRRVGPPDRNEIAKRFLDVLLASTREVMSSMAGMDFFEDNFDFKDMKDIAVDVSGIIGFSGFVEGGTEFTGSLAISTGEDLAKSIVSGMLMLSPDEIGEEEVKDGMGEVVNMVLGNAKFSSGKQFELSIPTVILGKDHELWSNSQAVTAMGVLRSPDGQRLYVRLSLEEKKEG